MGEQAGEMILHRPRLDRLRCIMDMNPTNRMKAAVSMAYFSDIIKKINTNLKENER